MQGFEIRHALHRLVQTGAGPATPAGLGKTTRSSSQGRHLILMKRRTSTRNSCLSQTGSSVATHPTLNGPAQCRERTEIQKRRFLGTGQQRNQRFDAASALTYDNTTLLHRSACAPIVVCGAEGRTSSRAHFSVPPTKGREATRGNASSGTCHRKSETFLKGPTPSTMFRRHRGRTGSSG